MRNTEITEIMQSRTKVLSYSNTFMFDQNVAYCYPASFASVLLFNTVMLVAVIKIKLVMNCITDNIDG